MLSTDQQSFDSTNPATGELVGAVAAMDVDDVRAAVAAARAVATDFAGLTLRQRATASGDPPVDR